MRSLSVFRSKAVRYLTEQRSNAGQNPFQLNELGYRCIAEHVVRAVLLGPRGHEVPPDMARPIHGIAAQKYEAGRLDRAHRDPVAGPEHQKLARPEAVACDLDHAKDRVEAALLVSWIERNARPCLKLRVGVVIPLPEPEQRKVGLPVMI